MKSYLWMFKLEDGEWGLMSWEGKVLTTQSFNSCSDDMPRIVASEHVPTLDFDKHVQNTIDGVYA